MWSNRKHRKAESCDRAEHVLGFFHSAVLDASINGLPRLAKTLAIASDKHPACGCFNTGETGLAERCLKQAFVYFADGFRQRPALQAHRKIQIQLLAGAPRRMQSVQN